MKKTSKFFEVFDKNRFVYVFKICLIFLFVFLIGKLITITYSRYESTVETDVAASIALFLIDQGTSEDSIALTGLKPSTEPTYYNVFVRNYDLDGHRANVNLKYKIKIETTTNLPLEYEVIRNESFSTVGYHNLLNGYTVRQDDNDVYYHTYDIDGEYTFNYGENHFDTYTIKVTFPEIYKNSPDSYQGKVELFSIILEAEQVA